MSRVAETEGEARAGGARRPRCAEALLSRLIEVVALVASGVHVHDAAPVGLAILTS
jgi:hypothetical protein